MKTYPKNITGIRTGAYSEVWRQGGEEEEGCLQAAGSHILKRLSEAPAKGNTSST